MIDVNKFRENQSRFPRAELEKYNGQCVAWSEDGTRILAADVDPIRVDALLQAAGFDPGEILVTRVAIPEEVSWSGWSVPEDPAHP
jgi:hypothetical protein